jgi:hypothetical protein
VTSIDALEAKPQPCAARLRLVKRGPGRAWPKNIVEVPAARPDPRAADPQATQKISREQLDAALKRTKSGTRRAVRSEPDLEQESHDAFAGPRDDGPQVTIVRIDSIELDAIDPASFAAMNALPPHPASLGKTASPTTLTPSPSPGTPISPTSAHAVELPEPGARASFARLIHRRVDLPQGLRITPRMAFLAGLAVAVFVVVAALVGFFAGRGMPSR